MKNLCERVINGQLQSNIGKYMKKISNPKYICIKCGRVANKKSLLCSPKLITSLSE